MEFKREYPTNSEDSVGEKKSRRRPYLIARDKVNRKGRIIVRNVSHKADENSISNFFKDYGNIQEVNILRYADGNMKGAAFVQFKSSNSALKAIRSCNLKPFLGRPIAVDWAIPKAKYIATLPKEEPKYSVEPVIKVENDSEGFYRRRGSFEEKTSNISESQAKQEPIDSSSEDDSEDENEDDDEEDRENNSGSDYDDASNNKTKSEDDEDLEDEEGKTAVKEEHKTDYSHKPVSRDVLEGKSVFLRNLSFDTTEEQIKNVLLQFGDLKYVLLCRDKITNRPRGSAFAQFLSKDSCDACLEAYEDPVYKTHFFIDGRKMFVTRALGRDDARKQQQEKKPRDEPRDKRNLYLAREGVIREGTQPAKDVSKADLRLRAQREIMKRKMLANFNIFFSPVRLFVCNLPPHIDDKGLRNIVQQHCSKETVIKECKVMRNLYELDREGKPVSKGHAFVAFTQHKHALEVLRNLNNNPSIFSVLKRPVVEFSMENRAALNAKMNRLEKSRIRNRGRTTSISTEFVSDHQTSSDHKDLSFMGSSYDPKKKGIKALQSHIGPKIRHRDSKTSKSGAKITRNEINNQTRRARGVKRKRTGQKITKGRTGKKVGKEAKTKKNKKEFKDRGRSKGDGSKKPKIKKRKFI